MTELRKRMIECLHLRGLSPRTQIEYLGVIRRLAKHFKKSPDLITNAELQRYFLHLINVKKYSPSALTVELSGTKFFYEKVLNKHWPILHFVRPARQKKLPSVLSPAEVRKVLRLIKSPRYRVCLTTIYSCGLRLQEGINLQVRDIDSARGMLHVRHGKGNKDRFVPLPIRTLELLRQYWSTHRNPTWLFPGGKNRSRLSHSTVPINESGLRAAFSQVVAESGINKRASIHTLRHSWATHLIEAGIGNIRLLQAYLGHSSLASTAIYIHITALAEHQGAETINRIMSDL
jgi:integrase/recombinase XerD